MTDYEVHAYLAGPDVFFPEAVEISKKKKDYLEKLGIVGHFPSDNEIPKEVFIDPKRA
jgi:nucleoside 2-deoxyribosyltransferase